MSFNSSRSADSGSKPKRSFNTNSSNSDNSSNSKKKKTGQKTLGMAWGANSRSSSRSSFQSSPFSDFGSYMAVKNRKLQDQFNAEATFNSGSNSGTPIFQGVSIFVDGFTVPSSQELRGYMVKHGGRFENYFSRHHVTHIICSNLPDSKIKNLRSFSGGLPVVKPAWVLDCVAANKLLSWVPYQLDQVASEAHNQPKLVAFLASKSIAVLNDSVCCATGQLKSETKYPSLKGGTSKEASGTCESMEHSGSYNRDKDDGGEEYNMAAVIEVSTYSDSKYAGEKLPEPDDVSKIDYNRDDSPVQDIPSRPTGSVSSNNSERSMGSAIFGHSSPCSTFADSNFVENYFKSSRLHFIGTWKSRYRKRFPNFRYTTSDANASTRRAVIHVDMDCFFVSVVIRNRPELQDKPVAVCHSDNPRGTSEISSANYPARDYGVRAGIFVRDAKARCPHLVLCPYDFQAYEEVADQFYHVLHKHCKRVQAVSCDEAFLDVTDSEGEDPQFLASVIRKEIFENTGCTASAGISGNLLMARLATRAAKPNGQYYIAPEKVDDYLSELPIKALPGIGHVLEEKLRRRQVQTCGQLRMKSKESLHKEFGIKTGDMLWNYSRGVDNRLVGMIQESKSIGAEVNWGVRFNELKDCQLFLMKLCKEVSLRLQGCAVQGRSFTLKIKKRSNDAEEPVKYMGCGDCENLSHSATVPLATDDVDVIQRIIKQLFGSFHIDVKDIRGMGLQVSKLESLDNAKQGHERNSLRSWLASASTSTNEENNTCYPAKENTRRDSGKQSFDAVPAVFCTDPMWPSVQIGSKAANAETTSNQDSALPPLHDLDLGVVESLPPDLFSEINAMYDGKLSNVISKRKGKSVDISKSPCSIPQETIQAVKCERRGAFFLNPACANDIPIQDKAETPSEAGPSKVVISTSVPCRTDLMPISLSQVDNAVLQQLPEDLRVDILEMLPEHRGLDYASNSASGSLKTSTSSLKCPDNETGSLTSVLKEELWVGNPPDWVKKFKDSYCSSLKILAYMYFKSGSTGHLSSILQTTLSETQLLIDACDYGWNDSISCLCDLFKQYIKLTIETDLEEIYVCDRLLRRLSRKSNFFLQVYDAIFPYLQASVAECYGGSLCISDGKE